MVPVIRLGSIWGIQGYHLQSLDRGIGHGDDEAYIKQASGSQCPVCPFEDGQQFHADDIYLRMVNFISCLD